MGRPKKVVTEAPGSVTVKTQLSSDVDKEPKNITEQKKQEKQEGEEADRAVKKSKETDPITQFLRLMYENETLKFIEDFADGRIPYLPDGSLLRVKRYYPTIKLIVDLWPKGTKQEDIDAKKWEFQRVGHRYSWIFEGEELECDPKDPNKQELIRRADPLKNDPEKRISFQVERFY